MIGVCLRIRILAVLCLPCLLCATAIDGQSQNPPPPTQPSAQHPRLQIGERPPIPDLDPPASKGVHQKPPFEIHICIAHCFVIQWTDGHYVNVGQKNSSTYTVDSFTRESVVMHRRDVGGFPLTADLTGRISPEGNSIVDGKIVWTSGNHGEGAFQAAWGSQVQTADWKALEARHLAADQAQARAAAGANNTQGMLSLLFALMGGNRSDNASGDLTAEISRLQDGLNSARQECGSRKVTQPGAEACARADGYEDKLIDANAALRQEIQSLQQSKEKLTAECKAQNKQSCTQLQLVKERLDKDLNFRALSIITDF